MMENAWQLRTVCRTLEPAADAQRPTGSVAV